MRLSNSGHLTGPNVARAFMLVAVAFWALFATVGCESNNLKNAGPAAAKADEVLPAPVMPNTWRELKFGMDLKSAKAVVKSYDTDFWGVMSWDCESIGPYGMVWDLDKPHRETIILQQLGVKYCTAQRLNEAVSTIRLHFLGNQLFGLELEWELSTEEVVRKATETYRAPPRVLMWRPKLAFRDEYATVKCSVWRDSVAEAVVWSDYGTMPREGAMMTFFDSQTVAQLWSKIRADEQSEAAAQEQKALKQLDSKKRNSAF